MTTQEGNIEYWKNHAEMMENNFNNLKNEYESFAKENEEYNAILEAELNDTNNEIKRLSEDNKRLKNNIDEIRSEYNQRYVDNQTTINQLTQNLETVKILHLNLENTLRTQEQSVDDYEMDKRTMITSLENFEYKLTVSLEKNAFLEGELVDKEKLTQNVQRLKDEIKDLRDELTYKNKVYSSFEQDKTIHHYSNVENIKNNEHSSPLNLNKIEIKDSNLGRSRAMNLVSEIYDRITKLVPKMINYKKIVDDSTNQIDRPTDHEKNISNKQNLIV
ncbi:Nuclear distribution protein nudE [Intoshia linei]|uniref:Nuclear distribution protein nudE n=1 Tax=Intoshia linei TaxID=1819745 RepID=A0A177B324_9BILA|nr:Nuclear distribution protein nudE [Intoshia linei]